MSDDITFDFREFNAGIEAVLGATKKTHPEILNKAALTVIIGSGSVRGAIQRTPRANFTTLDPRQVAGKVAARLRATGQKVTAVEFRNAVRAEISRRKKSRGYTAGPGWSQAAKAFGGRGVRTQKGFAHSKAAQGYGDKATPEQLIAEIANTAPAAEKIGKEALQAALNDTGRDMQEYAARKYQAIFDKHSAK